MCQHAEGQNVLGTFKGELVHIICGVNFSLIDYVRYVHGKKVLYLNSENIYMDILSQKELWYNIFTIVLKLEFNINPYNKCSEKRMVDDK